MEKTVELHPAHVWDCPDCGGENFCRCVVFEPDEADIKMGYLPGAWLTAPDWVTCAHCGIEHECEDMRD